MANSTKKTPKTQGRHDLTGARDPVGGFAATPRSVHNSRTKLGIVAVQDPPPFGDGRDRIRALVRIDLLDRERKRGLGSQEREGGGLDDGITEGAFQAGRRTEMIFERGARIGCGGQWREGDRVDSATAHDLALEAGAFDAIKVKKHLAWMVATLGRRDARILSRILGDRWTYERVAESEGRAGDRGARYIAARFRDALESLADAGAAVGSERPNINGGHHNDQADGRQNRGISPTRGRRHAGGYSLPRMERPASEPGDVRLHGQSAPGDVGPLAPRRR